MDISKEFLTQNQPALYITLMNKKGLSKFIIYSIILIFFLLYHFYFAGFKVLIVAATPIVAQPETFNETNSVYIKTSVFIAEQKVITRANVSDSEANWDTVLENITDSLGTSKVTNGLMTYVADCGTNCRIYEYNYSLGTSPPLGVWEINITANDTNANEGSNSTTFNITGVQWIVDASSNVTSEYPNRGILLYSRWNINTTLDKYLLSWNATGTNCDQGFQNETGQNLQAGGWTNTSKTIPLACEGKVIGFLFYANNTLGQQNKTNTATFTVNTITRNLIVSLTNPSPLTCDASSPCSKNWNDAFDVNATVKCKTNPSGYSCGDVYGSVRYNSSGTTPNQLISMIGGATPFFTNETNPISCGPLSDGEQCQLNWEVNATGALNSIWTIDANFSSDLTVSPPPENNTDNSYIKIADLKPPLYSSTGASATSVRKGQSILLYSYWTDNVNLSHATLATNETGEWENKSSYGSPSDFGSVQSAWSNFTWQNDSIDLRKVVAWRIYTNDTSDNWNSTPLQTFVFDPRIIITIESEKMNLNREITSKPNSLITVYGKAFYASDNSGFNNKPIRFTYDTTSLGNNNTNGTGFYTLSFSVSLEGVYVLWALTNDTYGNSGRNSSSLIIRSRPISAKYSLSYKLGTIKANDVYRIGSYNESADGIKDIGTTTTYSFYPNQRAICRDSSGRIHITWRKSTTTISYANSTDGINWLVSDTKVNSTGTKYTPSISCDGNSITIAYRNGSGLVVFISEDNGGSFPKVKVPVTSGVLEDVLVERRGQRIYIIYTNNGADNADDVNFTSSTDGGTSWTQPKIIFDGFYIQNLANTNYDNPAIAVDGSGSSSDKLYVAAEWSDSIENLWSMSFKNSSSAGASWSSSKTVRSCGSTLCENPSLTFSSSEVYIVYSMGTHIYFANSSGDFSVWNNTRIDTIGTLTNRARYPSVTVDDKGYPWVFWQQDNTTINSDNIVYRKYNGTHWLPLNSTPNDPWAVYNVTTDFIQNQFVNTPYRLNNKTEIIWRKGTSSPYKVMYGSDITITLYSTHLVHGYVCSYDRTEYLNGLLLSLVHSGSKNDLSFVNFSSTLGVANYTSQLKQKIENSQLILAYTKGTCEDIENKMYLVEKQIIPARTFSNILLICLSNTRRSPCFNKTEL
jgi:hypothetical protein